MKSKSDHEPTMQRDVRFRLHLKSKTAISILQGKRSNHVTPKLTTVQ